MAWTTQYSHEFYNLDGYLCEVYIKEDTLPAVDPDIEMGKNPVKLIRPQKDLLDTVRGSGCELTLFSETDRQFIDLFTADMDQYRVEVWVNSVLVWFGYLNSEFYSESYSEETNYYVKMLANNGFALLDRIKFLDGSGDPYTGLMTQWEVLQVILGYWGLMDLVSLLWVGINTTSTEITIGATETIFHHTYVSCTNYYDEDGEAMTCRQVLSAILEPYGAYIQMVGPILAIVDIDATASDISVKSYENDFTWYGAASSLAANVADLEDVGYYTTGAQLDGVPGINRQVIRFSKYTPDNLIGNIQDLSKMEFSSPLTEPQWTALTTCGASSYLATQITALENWTFVLGGTYTVGGAKEGTDGEAEYFIRMSQPEGSVPLSSSYYNDDHSSVEFPVPYVVGRNGFYLKIEGKLFPLTRTDPYVEEGSPCTDDADFNFVMLSVRVVVGDFLYQSNLKSWVSYPGTIQPEHDIRVYAGNAEENVANKWSTFQVLPWTHSETKKHPVTDDAVYVYLEDGVHGLLSLEFTREIWAYVDGTRDDAESIKIDELWMKDLKVSVVSNPDFVDQAANDIEYVGELNTLWKDEGAQITLLHGCSGVLGTPFDNGGLIYKDGSDDYFHFTEWTRGGQTNVIEKLLLNTIESNREAATYMITCTINNSSGFQSFRYRDTAYMGSKMFMVVASTLDVADCSEKIVLMEVNEDVHTIS